VAPAPGLSSNPQPRAPPPGHEPSRPASNGPGIKRARGLVVSGGRPPRRPRPTAPSPRLARRSRRLVVHPPPPRNPLRPPRPRPLRRHPPPTSPRSPPPEPVRLPRRPPPAAGPRTPSALSSPPFRRRSPPPPTSCSPSPLAPRPRRRHRPQSSRTRPAAAPPGIASEAAGDHEVGVAALDQAETRPRSRGCRWRRRSPPRSSALEPVSAGRAEPEAMFAIREGMKNGEIRPGPFSISTLCHSRMARIPPIPDPTRAPARVARPGSSRSSRSRPLHTGGEGVLDEQVELLQLLLLDHPEGSKPFTLPAMRVSRRFASKRVIGPIPTAPRKTAAQYSGTEFADGRSTLQPGHDDPHARSSSVALHRRHPPSFHRSGLRVLP